MARYIGPDYNENYGIVLPGFEDPIKPRSMTDNDINTIISYNPELVVYFDMLAENPVGSIDGEGNVSSDKYLKREITVPSDIWVIVHNLAKHPSITVVDSAGTRILGRERYIDLNTVEIRFASAFSGTCYLN